MSTWRRSASGAFKVRFTETLGFIRKLPHDLVASFRSTPEEAEDADVLIHVVDVAHGDWHQQVEVVNETLASAGLEGRLVVLALNKADLLDEPDRQQRLREASGLSFRAVTVSAVRRAGLDELTKLIGRC